MTTKTYIEFLHPGSFVANITTREVPDRSDPTDIPKGAYGYSFYSRTETVVEGENLIGKERDRSGTTYFGEAMNAEQIEKLPGDHTILLWNMRCNDWPTVVRSVCGNFTPLRPGDRVIAALAAKEQPK